MKTLVFKLKSAKILFAAGIWITIVIGGFAAFKHRDVDKSFKDTTTLVFENVIQSVAVGFVVLVNLYYSSKLVEGIVDLLPYKILPWVCINAVNVVQLTIYSFKIDTAISYLTLIVFVYIWMTIVVVLFEVRKMKREETVSCNQPASAPDDPVDVPYNTFSSHIA